MNPKFNIAAVSLQFISQKSKLIMQSTFPYGFLICKVCIYILHARNFRQFS